MSTTTAAGNITEPVLRFTQSGKAILSFGLAMTRKVNGEKQTTWIDVKAWGTLGENLAAELQKGDRVIVAGKLEQEKWTDKDGKERSKIVLVADDAGRSPRFNNEPAS